MNSVEQFFQEIMRYPLLTPAQEIELARQVQTMLELQRQTGELTPKQKKLIKIGAKARHKLIQCNLRLVVHLAKKNIGRGLVFNDLMDLVQEGTFGLVKAVEMFDPERGYKFSTYAYWWIRQSIGRGISHNEYAIHRSSKVVELENKLRRLVTQMQGELGRMPTTAELADKASTTISEIELIRMRGGHCVSLDAKLSSGEESTSQLIDLIPYEPPEEEELFERGHVKNQVMPHLHLLEDKERTAVMLRYGLCSGRGQTLAEIGAVLGLSRESSRKVVQRGLKKIVAALRQHGTYDDLQQLAQYA